MQHVDVTCGGETKYLASACLHLTTYRIMLLLVNEMVRLSHDLYMQFILLMNSLLRNVP